MRSPGRGRPRGARSSGDVARRTCQVRPADHGLPAPAAEAGEKAVRLATPRIRVAASPNCGEAGRRRCCQRSRTRSRKPGRPGPEGRGAARFPRASARRHGCATRASSPAHRPELIDEPRSEPPRPILVRLVVKAQADRARAWASADQGRRWPGPCTAWGGAKGWTLSRTARPPTRSRPFSIRFE